MKTKVLSLLAIAWLSLLYRYWDTVNWNDVKNILPSIPKLNGEYTVNIARRLTRTFCFFYLLGHVIYYYFFQKQYIRLLGRVTYFMTHYRVPKPIQERVLRCYKEAWSKNKIKFPISKLCLYVLPKVLLNLLIAYVGKTILEKLEMYHQCLQLLTSIAPKVHTLNYFSGDIVCKKEFQSNEDFYAILWESLEYLSACTEADKIYLVADGILEATTETGQHLETMSSGDIVGEIGVLHIDGYNVRTANVHSVTDSEVFAVNQKDVTEIINEFPDAKDMMVNIGKIRLQRSKTTTR